MMNGFHYIHTHTAIPHYKCAATCVSRKEKKNRKKTKQYWWIRAVSCVGTWITPMHEVPHTCEMNMRKTRSPRVCERVSEWVAQPYSRSSNSSRPYISEWEPHTIFHFHCFAVRETIYTLPTIDQVRDLSKAIEENDFRVAEIDRKEKENGARILSNAIWFWFLLWCWSELWCLTQFISCGVVNCRLEIHKLWCTLG